MSPSAGAIIWISIRPLIRLAAGVASGFILTKADLFPAVAARGAGQVVLKIALPSLLFSKLLPAFNTDNVKAIGPLALVAIIYELMGIALAWVIQKLFWVPHRFRYGFLIAGGWGNVSDIPTAVILSMTAGAPFNGTTDQDLAVAYISVFILVFMITLFPFGFHRWLGKDFVGPDVEPEVVQAQIKARRQRIIGFLLLRGRHNHPPPIQKGAYADEEKALPSTDTAGSPPPRRSIHDDATTTVVACQPDTVQSTPVQLEHAPTKEVAEITEASPLPTPETSPPPAPSKSFLYYAHNAIAYTRHFITDLINPVSLAVFISLPVSLVPQLKALFIPGVPGVHMPPAPDGQPPLAFIQDIATFMGGASVPLGLICLGSSLARLNVPLHQWRSLPIGAIWSFAIGKLIVTPVLGVLICKGLINAGLLSKDDKVLIFTSMFLSCLPTATTQVYLTQVYSATGSAEHLSAFLIPQYILMFMSMTALNAYCIQSIF